MTQAGYIADDVADDIADDVADDIAGDIAGDMCGRKNGAARNAKWRCGFADATNRGRRAFNLITMSEPKNTKTNSYRFFFFSRALSQDGSCALKGSRSPPRLLPPPFGAMASNCGAALSPDTWALVVDPDVCPHSKHQIEVARDLGVPLKGAVFCNDKTQGESAACQQAPAFPLWCNIKTKACVAGLRETCDQLAELKALEG